MRRGKTSKSRVALLGCLLVFGVASTSVHAGSVVDSGFCLKKAGRVCERRVPYQVTLSMKDLPVDDQGRRILYFFSVLDIEAGEAILHVWERTGDRYSATSKPRMFISNSMIEDLRNLHADLESKIEGFSIKTGKNVFVVPFISRVGSAKYTAYSYRVVSGPGAFAARVLDADGKPPPGSKMMEVRIVP